MRTPKERGESFYFKSAYYCSPPPPPPPLPPQPNFLNPFHFFLWFNPTSSPPPPSSLSPSPSHYSTPKYFSQIHSFCCKSISLLVLFICHICFFKLSTLCVFFDDNVYWKMKNFIDKFVEDSKITNEFCEFMK